MGYVYYFRVIQDLIARSFSRFPTSTARKYGVIVLSKNSRMWTTVCSYSGVLTFSIIYCVLNRILESCQDAKCE
jgi:hypothetical protein